MKSKKRLLSLILGLTLALGTVVGLGTTVFADGDAASGGSDSAQFKSDGGHYTDWVDTDNAFVVPNRYANQITKTSKTEFSATNVTGNAKTYIDNVINSGYTTSYDLTAQSMYNDPSIAFTWNLKTATKGDIQMKATNLRVYNPDTNDFDDVDMKVTVTDWTASSKDRGLEYLFIQKSATPYVHIFGEGHVAIRYQYYKAGTDTPYTLESNLTFGDIDAGQSIRFVGFDAKYLTMSKDTNLNYDGNEQDGFTVQQKDYAVHSNIPQDAVGAYFEEPSYSLVFGTSEGGNGAWSTFTSGNYDMAFKEPNTPYKRVSDSDEDDVKANKLEELKETYTYDVYHIVTSGYVENTYFTSYTLKDTLEDALTPKTAKVYNGSTDVSSKFDITISGQNVTAKMKSTYLTESSTYNKTYDLRIKAQIKYDWTDSHLDKYKTDENTLVIPNQGSVSIKDASDKGKVGYNLDTNKVTTTVQKPPVPTPEKKVTDKNETKVVANTLDKVKESYDYEVSQKISSGAWKYTSIVLTDEIKPYLVINSIKVVDDTNKDVTDDFTITKANNKVVAKGKSSFVSATTFLNHTYTMKINASISNDLTFEEAIAKGYIKDGVIVIDNKAVVSVDGDDKPTNNATTTTTPPPTEKPQKTVSDKDETDVTANTMKTPEEVFTYKITQVAPELNNTLKFKSFTMEDTLEECLQIKSTKVVDKDGKDVSSLFTIKTEGQKVTAVAKDTLADTFYGNTYVLVIEAKVNEEVSQETLAKHGHYNENKTAITFENEAKTSFDGKFTNTNKVTTTVELPKKDEKPGVALVKTAEPYENLVNDDIKYTIKAHQVNPKATAYKVVIKDTDFPKGFTIDEKSLKVEGINRDYTIKGVDNGFEFTTKYLEYGETITITFTGKADKTLNGTLVPNVATVSAWGVPDNSDDAEVYINSPKMDVKKTTSAKVANLDDTINYQLDITQINKGCFMRNVYVEDEIKTEGVKLDKGSFSVSDAEGNLLALGTDYKVKVDGNKFVLTFVNGNMGYYKDAKIPATESKYGQATGNYENLNLQSKYVVTYTATIDDDSLAGKEVVNEVKVPATPNTNNKIVPDDGEIPSGGDKDIIETPVKGPQLKITKTSDKKVYDVGETGHYTLRINEVGQNMTAKNIVIKDKFELEGMEIQEKTIKVFYDGENITKSCKISINDMNGYYIETGRDLQETNEIKVTYDVVFVSETLANKAVINVAKAKADNCTAKSTNDITPIQIAEGLTALKTADPISGKVVKAGQEITYHITLNNTSDKDMQNILVKDMIPTLTEFVSSEDGEVKKIDDNNYFTAVVKEIKAGESQTVSFKVKVSKDATEDDVIENVALIRVPEEGDINPDGTPNENVWEKPFVETNKVEHPLSYWAKDSNEVSVSVPNAEIVVTKKVAEKSFVKGDTLHYTVKTTSTKNTAKQVVITDNLKTKNVTLNAKSIKVVFNKKDITKSCKITTTKTGFEIKTGVDLKKDEFIDVTYTVKAGTTEKEIDNVATSKAINSDKKTDDENIGQVTPNVEQTTTNTVSKTVSGTNPNTGDGFNMLWVVAFVLAIIGAVGSIVVRRKDKRVEE